jgi:hypothetical protein
MKYRLKISATVLEFVFWPEGKWLKYFTTAFVEILVVYLSNLNKFFETVVIPTNLIDRYNVSGGSVCLKQEPVWDE